MKKQSFLILFLIIFAFTGVLTFLDRGTTYIGKNAIDAGVVQHLQESYIDYVYETEIVQAVDQKMLENLTVTAEEVELYRTYYGTKTEQIQKIKAQYQNPTEDEKAIRDEKIEEVTKNFEDEEAVRDKVLALKKEAVAGYLKETTSDVEPFDKAKHFEYYIEVDGELYKKKEETAAAIRELSEKYSSQYEPREIDSADYVNNGISIPFTFDLEYPASVITVKLLNTIYGDPNYGDEIENFEWRKIAFYIIWGLTLLAIAYLMIKRKAVQEALRDVLHVKLPKFTRFIDVNALIVVIGMIWSFNLAKSFSEFVESIVYNLYYGHSLVSVLFNSIQFVLLAFLTVFTLLVALKLVEQLRTGKFMNEQFISSKIIYYTKEVFDNRSLTTQMLGALFVFACAGFGLAVVFVELSFILVYVPLFMLIVIPVLFMYVRRFAYLSRIIRHTEQLANGMITSPIEAKGESAISKHADHINKIQDGVRQSVQAQAKSERLKTELITNVSHDLRTPLTSIITYTDLLKSDDLTEEERQKYVAVLETKSQRLKTLIEDLFEVSKMASGNITLQKQQIDVAQLLQQIVAEHEEDFEQYGLALRVAIEEQPLNVQADGQKLSRVIDNLLINARKYSLGNTRVYVTLKQEEQQVLFTLKNVTKYELGENIEELTERFKRGDASRNTEGSGLGLAIAQSIVELHGGTMEIELIGDLFQVTVRLPL